MAERYTHHGSELDSSHLIFASEAPLALFTAMLRHGASIRDCTLVPVPKCGKDIAQSESYGSGSKYQQIYCLNGAYTYSFPITSVLQIGFKSGLSTSSVLVPSRMLRLDTYIETPLSSLTFWMLVKQSTVTCFNCCLTGLPECVIQLIRNWYTDQKLSVRWNSQL